MIPHAFTGSKNDLNLSQPLYRNGQINQDVCSHYGTHCTTVNKFFSSIFIIRSDWAADRYRLDVNPHNRSQKIQTTHSPLIRHRDRGGNRRSRAGRRLVPNAHSAHGSLNQRPGLQAAAAPFHLGGRGTAARRGGAAGTEAVSHPAPRTGRSAAAPSPRGRGRAAAPSPARRAQAGGALLLTRGQPRFVLRALAQSS